MARVGVALAALLWTVAGCGSDGGDGECVEGLCAGDGGPGGDAALDADASSPDGGRADAGGRDGGGELDGGCRVTGTPCSSASLLVDGDWLEARLDDGTVQVLDVRSRSAYESGHVPGALQLASAEVRATVDGVSGQVAPAADVQAALREAGVQRDATVVTYGAGSGLNAARVLWTLQYYGHADVRRLDGGWGVWSDEGRPTESGAPVASASEYAIDGPRAELRVEADWLLERLDDPSVTIVDVRTAGEYDAGHIPGAVHQPWPDATDADGRMKPASEVDVLFDVPEGQTVVTYCTTGTRASMGYFTFRWLGHADVRLYDGSWAEWGSRSDLPKL